MRNLSARKGLFSAAFASALWSTAMANDPTCCCTAHSTPSCSDTSCASTICAFDAYCCTVRWDATCASEAAQYCGAAAPYCVDANQDNMPDICASGGGSGGSDCDGDGLPDTQRDGPAGKSSWIGATSGFQTFEPDQNWSIGRPGALTFAEISVPYTPFYDFLQIKSNCDNAVRALAIVDGGSSTLHDLDINLNARTMRFAGPSAHSVLVTPAVYDRLRLAFIDGAIDASTYPFTINSTGALQLTFDNVDLDTTAFSWKTNSSWSADPLRLSNSEFRISTWNWPKDETGGALYANLRLSLTKLAFQGESSTFTVPDRGWITVSSESMEDFSDITGPGLAVVTEPGSLVTLDGSLRVGGSLTIGGELQIRPHCLPLAQGCHPSVLITQDLVCGADAKSSITCSVDLSGTSGTTPLKSPVISASSTADVGGILNINDMSNGEPILEGYSVPLLSAANFTAGGSNFDVVRVLGAGLSNGLYVTTTASAGTISLEVRRGAQVSATPVASASTPQAPIRSVVLDDGARTGVQRLVSVVTPSQGYSMLRIERVDPQNGLVVEWAGYGLADPTDLDVGDVDGDGERDVVVSYGSPGVVTAFKQVVRDGATSLVTMWQHQLERGRRAECVAVLAPNGGRASILPVGSSTVTGTSKNGTGGITTISSSGADSGSAETAAVPRTVRGTDIDNDEDTDVVAAGGSDAAGLLPSGSGGFIQVIQRGVTGGLVALQAIQTVGVPNALAIGDLDGDGFLDVAASCDGITGSFPSGARPTGIVLRGAPASGPGARPSLLRNPCPIDVGDATAQGSGVSILDGDGDGNLDLALAWQSTDFQTMSGGAAMFPIRDPRPTGGLSIARPTHFVTGRVLQMISAGSAGVITFTQSRQNLADDIAVEQTEFAAIAIEGDLDGDGVVGTADISLLLLDFGPCSGSPCTSDLDGSGEVDTGDLSLLLLLFS